MKHTVIPLHYMYNNVIVHSIIISFELFRNFDKKIKKYFIRLKSLVLLSFNILVLFRDEINNVLLSVPLQKLKNSLNGFFLF
jgi:hypothetical protein